MFGYRIVGNTVFDETKPLDLIESGAGQLSLTRLDSVASELTHCRQHGVLVEIVYVPGRSEGVTRLVIAAVLTPTEALPAVCARRGSTRLLCQARKHPAVVAGAAE